MVAAEGIDCDFAKGGTVVVGPHAAQLRAGPGRGGRGPARGASARTTCVLLGADEAARPARPHRRARRDVHAALRGDPPRPAGARAGAGPWSAAASPIHERTPVTADRARRRDAPTAAGSAPTSWSAPPRATRRSCPGMRRDARAGLLADDRHRAAAGASSGTRIGLAGRRDLHRPPPPDRLRAADRGRPAGVRRPRRAVPLRLADPARARPRPGGVRRAAPGAASTCSRPSRARRSPTRGAARSGIARDWCASVGLDRAHRAGLGRRLRRRRRRRRPTSPAAPSPTWCSTGTPT